METDGGTSFGKWPNRTAQLIYFDAMPALLPTVTGPVVDLGGGNGLLKQWLPQALSVDKDASKEPDVVADLLTWSSTNYPTGVMRYVLHYLPDEQAQQLLTHVATYLNRLVLVQFVNDDLPAKQANSLNEQVWFRTETQLSALLGPWQVVERRRLDYTVDAEFYRWRLNNPNGTAHTEGIVMLDLRV